MKKVYLVCRWKVNRAHSKDMISQLPDHLICHILSLLSTKEAVKTSVLSTRWRQLWLWLPSLELKSRDFSDFNNFMSFGYRFFDSNRVSCKHKLKLTIHRNEDGVKDAYYLTPWLKAAVKHKIQHLHVHSYSYADHRFHKMPQRLYTCHTLVCLKLFQVTLDDAGFVFLPKLKTMHLEYVKFPNEATFETLVLCCPVLEDLKIFVANDDGKVFRVHSLSLKRLTFERVSSFFSDSAGVVIDAPRLCFLKINDNVSKRFIVDSLDSNTILDMSLVFGLEEVDKTNWDEFDDGAVLGEFDESIVSPMRSSISDFLSGISRVSDMSICARTFKLLYQYSKLQPLPKFGHTSRLQITLCT
ncbi:putative FBD-associated F-box protein At5g53635 [Eutrema salsugineum]|uniref:putative FBD-associated F-box protein At5g53635 n=1 Tax=Eutrema salsugineum TaxID=72664 RepID=UPI000CED2CD2|nr:putative FBD-associated F-box protein At5g53635 [Eutrema salsugineum]